MAKIPKTIGPTTLTGGAYQLLFTAPANAVCLLRYIHCLSGGTGSGTVNHLSLSIGTVTYPAGNIYSQIGLPGTDQREDGALERFVYITMTAGQTLNAGDDSGSSRSTITIGYDEVSI